MIQRRIPVEFLDFTDNELLEQYRAKNVKCDDSVYIRLQETSFIRKQFEHGVSAMLTTCKGLYVKPYKEYPCVLRSTRIG